MRALPYSIYLVKEIMYGKSYILPSDLFNILEILIVSYFK